jgi:hypothetical protein
MEEVAREFRSDENMRYLRWYISTNYGPTSIRDDFSDSIFNFPVNGYYDRAFELRGNVKRANKGFVNSYINDYKSEQSLAEELAYENMGIGRNRKINPNKKQVDDVVTMTNKLMYARDRYPGELSGQRPMRGYDIEEEMLPDMAFDEMKPRKNFVYERFVKPSMKARR